MNKQTSRALFFLSFCAFFTIFYSSCTGNESNNKVYFVNEKNSSYVDCMEQILPGYAPDKSNRPYPSLQSGAAAAEAFDMQAIPAVKAGVAEHWYPHYLATVVIAVDRDLTDAVISGWNDLLGANEIAGYYDNGPFVFTAIAYGLEGENFTLGRAAGLLAGLRENGCFARNSFDPAIVICYDFQAAAMIRDGRSMEIIVPAEGTLTYERGLLSQTELVFAGDADSLLLLAGFRLPDGRCDESLYPDAAAYAAAHRIADYDHFNTACQEYRIFRRKVLRSRLHNTADGREHQLAALLYMVFVIVWLSSTIYRSMQKSVQRSAMFTGIALLGWMTVRTIKWQLIADTTLARYLWFSYYIFELALPLLVLWLAWAINKPAGEGHPPKWLRFLAVIYAALIALVLTNDLHNFVFQIDLSTATWSNDYVEEIGYLITRIAYYGPIAVALVIMLIKIGRNPRMKSSLFPAVFFVLLVIYGVGYSTRIPFFWDSDITMVTGAFTLLIFEASLQTGLIPVNTKYAALFTHSPLRMQITGADGNAGLSSALSTEYEKDTLIAAVAARPLPVQPDANTLLFAAKITGGNAFWQEDISKLNRLHAKTEESVKKLAAANAVLAEEEKIKRTVAEEREKIRLMAKLEDEIFAHMDKLSLMIERLDSAEDQMKEATCAALFLCYLKRRCNLLLREQETELLPSEEIKYYTVIYTDELAEIAAQSGAKIICTGEVKTTLTTRIATIFYDLYFQVIDWAVKHGWSGILLHWGAEN